MSSYSISPKLMEIQDKSDDAQICAVLGTRGHIDTRTIFWNKTFLPIR